jgi:hypothetical protein
VRVGGGGEGVIEIRPQRGARFGETGGVIRSWCWKERLEGRGWAEGLAAPLMPR